MPHCNLAMTIPLSSPPSRSWYNVAISLMDSCIVPCLGWAPHPRLHVMVKGGRCNAAMPNSMFTKNVVLRELVK
jgi:hypothetical protein